MDSLTTALTIAIAAGAVAQAFFAGRLWLIQWSNDRERKRTHVAVALDLKGSPTQAFLEAPFRQQVERSSGFALRRSLPTRGKRAHRDLLRSEYKSETG